MKAFYPVTHDLPYPKPVSCEIHFIKRKRTLSWVCVSYALIELKVSSHVPNFIIANLSPKHGRVPTAAFYTAPSWKVVGPPYPPFREIHVDSVNCNDDYSGKLPIHGKLCNSVSNNHPLGCTSIQSTTCCAEGLMVFMELHALPFSYQLTNLSWEWHRHCLVEWHKCRNRDLNRKPLEW